MGCGEMGKLFHWCNFMKGRMAMMYRKLKNMCGL